GIRDFHVTGVQTCALPIWAIALAPEGIESGIEYRREIYEQALRYCRAAGGDRTSGLPPKVVRARDLIVRDRDDPAGRVRWCARQIGRASCRERGEDAGAGR